MIYDIAIIGGGIVGLATAFALSSSKLSLIVLEAEDQLASHQTGHNSGVIHSGLYYKPGSLKATNCTQGREEMIRFCDTHGIRYKRCGKIVVATEANQVAALDELERRGTANGLVGIKRLSADEMSEHEPNVAGVAALHVPETGIIHYPDVCRVMAALIQERGGTIQTGSRIIAVAQKGPGITLCSANGDITCRYVINCSGLHADRLARLCGIDPQVQIIPFRGEYYELRPERRSLVKNLIYPVPDPRFPFLGVHFTRRVDGTVEAGPNAVLALKREGYRKWSFSARDTSTILSYPGFWRMALKYWKNGCGEIHRSLSKQAFVKALQKLMPHIQSDDLVTSGTGVRAQAVKSDGSLMDDFYIKNSERMVHVLNAPSPAATASLTIGKTIARAALSCFGYS